MVSGVITGLVAFIAVRVITGLGEGAFYSNDRSLIAQDTPLEKRSLGMGVVITGLALGITIATVFAPNMISLGGDVFADPENAWRMPFLILGACTLVVGIAVAAYFRRQEPGLPYARATLHLLAYSAARPGRGDGRLLRRRRGGSVGAVDRACSRSASRSASSRSSSPASRARSARSCAIRDLVLINLAFIAVLWNLWFFSFWSVSIVADAAGSCFGRSAMIAAFNAGAGILGFPTGGWLSDVAVRRGIGRKPLVVGFTAIAVRAHGRVRVRRRRRRAPTCG